MILNEAPSCVSLERSPSFFKSGTEWSVKVRQPRLDFLLAHFATEKQFGDEKQSRKGAIRRRCFRLECLRSFSLAVSPSKIISCVMAILVHSPFVLLFFVAFFAPSRLELFASFQDFLLAAASLKSDRFAIEPFFCGRIQSDYNFLLL